MTDGATRPRPAKRDLWLPGVLVFTILIATAVFGTRPLISYLALSRGANPADLGLIASSFAILATAAALPLGRLVDRRGERPVMFGGGVVCLVACALLPAMNTIPLLAVATALLGIGQMMAVVGAQTMLANGGIARSQALNVGLYASAASLGHGLGPVLGGVVVGDSIEGGAPIASLGAAAIAAAAACIALVLPKPTHRAIHAGTLQPIGVLQTLRVRGMVPALTAGIVSLTAVDLMVAYLPAYGEERAISPQMIGFALGALAIAQMMSRLSLGWLLNRRSYATILIGSIALAATAIPVLVAPINELGLMLVMVIAGLGLGLAQPLTMLWIAIATPVTSRGLAMGLRMGGNRLAQLFIPAALGATAGQLGIGAILVAIAALLAASGGYVARARRQFLPEPNPLGARGG